FQTLESQPARYVREARPDPFNISVPALFVLTVVTPDPPGPIVFCDGDVNLQSNCQSFGGNTVKNENLKECRDISSQPQLFLCSTQNLLPEYCEATCVPGTNGASDETNLI
ncbi:unnamed protein product, partial [Allacma fusca]